MRYYDRDSFDADCSLGYHLRRVFQLSQAGMEPLHAGEGVTGVQWSALALLVLARASTCAELARDLAYDKGAMTRLADQLEAAGYLERVRDTGDRRVLQLKVTPQGRDKTETLRRAVLERWNDWLADWSREEVDTLLALLRKLGDTLEGVAK